MPVSRTTFSAVITAGTMLWLFLAPVALPVRAADVRVLPQTGHGTDIQCLLLSQEGRLAASADDAGAIKIWNLKERRLVATLPPPISSHGVFSMTFSPGNDLLYVAYFWWHDARITVPDAYIWDLESLKSVPIETDGEETAHPFALFARNYVLRFGLEARDRPEHGYQLLRSANETLQLKRRSIRHIRKSAPSLMGRYLGLWKQLRNRIWSDVQLRDYRAISGSTGSDDEWLDNVKHIHMENRILIHRVLHSGRMKCPIVEQVLTDAMPERAVQAVHKSGTTRVDVQSQRLLLKTEAGGTTPVGFPSAIVGSSVAQTDSAGRYLVSGHADGTIRLWELATGAQIAHRRICKTEVVAAAPVAAKPRHGDLPPNEKAAWPRGLALCNGERPFLVDFNGGSARNITDFVAHIAARIEASDDGELALVFNHMSFDTTNLDITQIIDVQEENPVYRSQWLSKDQWAFQRAVTTMSPDGKFALFAGRSYPVRRGKSVERTLSEKENSGIQFSYGQMDHVKGLPESDDGGGTPTTELDAFQVSGSQFLVSLTHTLDESQEGYLTLWQVPEFQRVVRVYNDDLYDASVIGAVGDHVVLVGHDDGKVSAYLVPSLELIGTQPAHDGPITGLSRSAKNNPVITTSQDGSIHLWRWSGAQNRLIKLASMHGLPDGEWLTITPEGFFGGSPTAGSMINVVRDTDVSSVAQLFEHLHRPDLLEELFKGDPERKYKDATAKLNLARILESGPAPRLELLDRKTERAGGTVRLSVRLNDEGGGFGERVVWRVNGITKGTLTPPALEGGIKARERASVTITQTLRIDPSRSNRIEVTAYNQAGLVAASPLQITVDRFGATADERPRMHVLAVGVDRYRMPDYELRHAVNDAKKLSQALKVIGGTLFSGVSVSTLTDEEVTRDNIAAAFDRLSVASTPSDVFVLFLAGHGKSVAGRYYYYPQTIDFQAGHNVEEHGIGQDAWQTWLAKLPMQKTLLIIDTCESGAATSLIRGGFAARQTAMNQLQYATGHNIIAAARAAQPAYEGYKDHGVLTYALLEAFSGEDTEARKEKIMLFDLAARVGERVPEITRSLFGIAQWTRPKLAGDNFPIGLRQATADIFGEPTIARTPSHVVISAVAVRERPEASAPEVASLVPGTQVRIVEFAGESWAAIARDGRKIGYLPVEALAKLQ